MQRAIYMDRLFAVVRGRLEGRDVSFLECIEWVNVSRVGGKLTFYCDVRIHCRGRGRVTDLHATVEFGDGTLVGNASLDTDVLDLPGSINLSISLTQDVTEITS